MNNVTQADRDAALKHLGWESISDLHYWAVANDIQRFEQLERAFTAHRIAAEAAKDAEIAALQARVAELENEREVYIGAISEICVHSNTDWPLVANDLAGALNRIHGIATDAFFKKEPTP